MLVNFMIIWNILSPFWHISLQFGNVVEVWYIYPVLVYCVKKNLAILLLRLGIDVCKRRKKCSLLLTLFPEQPNTHMWVGPEPEPEPEGRDWAFLLKRLQARAQHAQNSGKA
jgi:hypothetical protein